MEMNLQRVKNILLTKYPLFGLTVANASFIISDEDTASTDGIDIYYNPSFMNSLSEAEQVFVLAHEISHIALHHIARGEGKNEEDWNVATDAVINELLEKDGLQSIKGCVHIENASQYSAEQIYEKIRKEGNPYPKDGVSNHKKWDNGRKKKTENSEKEKAEGEKSSSQTTPQNAGSSASAPKEADIFEQNQEVCKQKAKELCEQLAKEVMGASGKTTAKARTVSFIGTKSHLIDWRYLLKDATSVAVDWSYKNATIEEGVVTPYLETYPYPKTEILLDTSGSISEALLRNFLKECKNILQTSEVKVGCFDDAFYGFQRIHSLKDIDALPFQGGGGTNFEVAVNSFSRRAENKIIFTDGMAKMPSTKANIIWIVFGGYQISPSKGSKVIYIDEKQLQDLYCRTWEDMEQVKVR